MKQLTLPGVSPLLYTAMVSSQHNDLDERSGNSNLCHQAGICMREECSLECGAHHHFMQSLEPMLPGLEIQQQLFS